MKSKDNFIQGEQLCLMNGSMRADCMYFCPLPLQYRSGESSSRRCMHQGSIWGLMDLKEDTTKRSLFNLKNCFFSIQLKTIGGLTKTTTTKNSCIALHIYNYLPEISPGGLMPKVLLRVECRLASLNSRSFFDPSIRASCASSPVMRPSDPDNFNLRSLLSWLAFSNKFSRFLTYR